MVKRIRTDNLATMAASVEPFPWIWKREAGDRPPPKTSSLWSLWNRTGQLIIQCNTGLFMVMCIMCSLQKRLRLFGSLIRFNIPNLHACVCDRTRLPLCEVYVGTRWFMYMDLLFLLWRLYYSHQGPLFGFATKCIPAPRRIPFLLC